MQAPREFHIHRQGLMGSMLLTPRLHTGSCGALPSVRPMPRLELDDHLRRNGLIVVRRQVGDLAGGRVVLPLPVCAALQCAAYYYLKATAYTPHAAAGHQF